MSNEEKLNRNQSYLNYLSEDFKEEEILKVKECISKCVNQEDEVSIKECLEKCFKEFVSDARAEKGVVMILGFITIN